MQRKKAVNHLFKNNSYHMANATAGIHAGYMKMLFNEKGLYILLNKLLPCNFLQCRLLK